jgi:hypothetical protein
MTVVAQGTSVISRPSPQRWPETTGNDLCQGTETPQSTNGPLPGSPARILRCCTARRSGRISSAAREKRVPAPGEVLVAYYVRYRHSGSSARATAQPCALYTLRPLQQRAGIAALCASRPKVCEHPPMHMPDEHATLRVPGSCGCPVVTSVMPDQRARPTDRPGSRCASAVVQLSPGLNVNMCSMCVRHTAARTWPALYAGSRWPG